MDDIRSRVTLTEHEVLNVHTSDYPGAYPGYTDKWSFKKFKKNFKIDIKSMSSAEMEFDMIGIDASLANAFRRILLAEVPTMAADRIIISNNTSIIQDEVLAHRIGLVPFKADPRLFEYKKDMDEEGSETDVLIFELKVKCKKNPKATKESTDPDDLYIDHKVTTSHIKWQPIGNQASMFKEDEVGPVFNDILIAKLRPGQEIDLKLHCVKGIGRDHAKFSPVATAWYRLMPEVVITEPVQGEMAHRLQRCFSPGVIEIVEEDGVETAIVADSRNDACSREVLRHDDLRNCVKLNRIRDHFIFTVETTGALPPNVLVLEAIRILSDTCKFYLSTPALDDTADDAAAAD